MKQKLNITDYRETNRRVAERRYHKRRVIPHAFGTAEWIQAVQQAYVFWPRQDRRSQERRVAKRRGEERRIDVAKYRQLSLRRRIHRQTPQTQILSREERQMLHDLNNRR